MQQTGFSKQQLWSLLLGVLAIFALPLNVEHKLNQSNEVNFSFLTENRQNSYFLLAENVIVSTQRLIKQQNAKYQTSHFSAFRIQHIKDPQQGYTTFINQQHSIRAGPIFLLT